MTHRSTGRTSSRTTTRVAVQAALVVVLLALQVAPALAHGFPTAGPPNWVSQVTVDNATDLTWQVVGVDAAIRLVNDSGDEVLIRGYADEPYLRIGPEGVFENQRSSATWLGRNRLGDLTTVIVPDDLDNTAPPDWVRVGDGPTWTWFDHRIHWIAPTRLPAGVEARPDQEQVVSTWDIPAERAGTAVGPTGELRWVPPGTTRLPVLGLAAVVAVLLGLVSHRRGGTTLALVLLVVAVAAGVAEVGALLELGVAAGSGAVTSAWLRSAVLVVAALATLLLIRRGDDRATWVLVLLAAILAFTVGWRELDVVVRSAVPGPVPALAARAVVAVALGAGLAALGLLTASPQREPV